MLRSAMARWLRALQSEKLPERALSAGMLACCGEASIPVLIDSLEQSLARESANGVPESQSDVSDALLWALTNSVGLPEDPLIEWLRRGTDPAQALPEVVLRERAEIVLAILGARRSLPEERIVALLNAPEPALRRLGVGLAPALGTPRIATRLMAIGDVESDPALRHDARLAAIVFKASEHAETWIAQEADPPRRRGLTQAAVQALPLSFLLDRSRPPFDVTIRREALNALAARQGLPAATLGPLLIALEDPTLLDPPKPAGGAAETLDSLDGFNPDVDLVAAIERIDAPAAVWDRYLPRLLDWVRGSDDRQRTLGLRLLAHLGPRAGTLHAALQGTPRRAIDSSGDLLDQSILATAPSDEAQVALALARLEQVSLPAAGGASIGTYWMRSLRPGARLAAVKSLSDRLVSPALDASRREVFALALSEAISAIFDSADEPAMAAASSAIARPADSAHAAVLCQALHGNLEILESTEFAIDAATALWWSACQPQMRIPAVPGRAEVRRVVRQMNREGYTDPLESYLVDSDFDELADRAWFETLLGDRVLPPSAGLVTRWCHTAMAEKVPVEQVIALLARSDWAHAERLLACPLLHTPTSAASLWERALVAPASFLDYAERKDGRGCGIVLFALEARGNSLPLSAREARLLGDLLAGDRTSACAAQALQSVRAHPALTRALLGVARGRDVLAAQTAIETLARTVPDSDATWPKVVGLATEMGMVQALRDFDRNAGVPALPEPDLLSAGGEGENIIVTGSRTVRGGLPPFPWPPPKNASRATFGVDVPRSLLGSETATLDATYHRLIAALESIDTQYSSGLFAAAGGFVLLTRMEQVDEVGRSVARPYRWRAYQPPPASMSDYLTRLFLAPPGHYRTLAFVFTSETNLAPGTGALPAIEEGDTVLPDEIAEKRFDSVRAYVLVYAYTKKDTDQVARVWSDLSGKQHLDRARILSALQH